MRYSTQLGVAVVPALLFLLRNFVGFKVSIKVWLLPWPRWSSKWDYKYGKCGKKS